MYRKIADEFVLKIVAGQYIEACEMLAEPAASKWDADSLKAEYQEMIEYFEGSAPEVITNWDELEDIQLDHGVMIYVPVESDEGGEAITTVIDKSGKIIEVEFGRP